jgi:hypothetical protein
MRFVYNLTPINQTTVFLKLKNTNTKPIVQKLTQAEIINAKAKAAMPSTVKVDTGQINKLKPIQAGIDPMHLLHLSWLENEKNGYVDEQR